MSKGYPSKSLLAILCCCLCGLSCFLDVTHAGSKRRSKSVSSHCHIDPNNVTLSEVLDCVRDKSLLYLDRITTSDSIDLLGSGAVKLVRRNSSDSDQSSFPTPPKGLSGAATADGTGQARDNSTWALHVVNKLGHLLQTHVLQIDVIGPTNNKASAAVGEGRRRRNQMMPMMLFGLVAIGMILIPIGFQLMSIFAGKAVLLSKLALMLASLNGLKRLANSGINYGLYTVPEPPYVPPYPHPRPMWDRNDHPREGY